MKIYGFFISVAAIVAFTSCKSLSKLTSKDSSSTAAHTPKKKQSAQVEFLDQIEVTPGGVVTSKHKTSTTNEKGAMTAARSQVGNTRPNTGLASVDIEKSNWLQLKYAVVMDASVEKLTNIPLLETIDKWWGTRYCMGGITDNCIDCSAFTQVVMKDVYQVNLPRTAQEQYNISDRIDLEDLREGDLVFFHTNGREISHVGIYMLNNKFVHAATSGGVMISDLTDKYWQPKLKGAGRVVKQPAP